MASSNQGGSILSFLVIGGALAALLIGGTYLVQQRATQSTADQSPVAVQPTNQSPKEDEKKTPPPAEEKKEAPKAAPQTTTPPATELPKTGPAEMISSIIGAGLLSGVLVAYARSRRASVTL